MMDQNTQPNEYILTQQFMNTLRECGLSSEQIAHEGYIFAEAALRGDAERCMRLNLAAGLVKRAVYSLGIGPNQQRVP